MNNSILDSSVFQSIKGALAKDNKGSGDILKTEVGNTYTVRLLPAKDPKKTFFHYYQHGWVSNATGEYVAAISPTTFEERDPIAEERYRVRRTGSETEKKKIEAIRRGEKWLVNVYVVNDPVNAENNGKVKLLRYGKQLHNIIVSGIEGEDAEDIGSRMFDLGPNGVNLRIKVEKQGDFPSYVSSKFSMPAAIPEMTDEKAKKIYSEVYELDKVFTIKSYDELKAMLDEHYHCSAVKDEIAVSDKVEPSTSKPVETSKNRVSVENDDEVEKLLEGLTT